MTTEITVVHDHDHDPIGQALHKAQDAIQKPEHISDDIWSITTAFAKHGGLVNTANQISELAHLAQELRESTPGGMGMSPKDFYKMRLDITEKLAKLKKEHWSMMLEKRNVITYPLFQSFLTRLFEILSDELNESTMAKVGSRLIKEVEIFAQRKSVS